jgi:AcrR family transcriptional regulator
MTETGHVNGSQARLLHAADLAVAKDGLGALSIDSVARDAGVSRATAYRSFSGREDLLIELALLRASRYVDATRQLMSAATGFGSQIEAGYLHLVEALPQDEVIRALFRLRSAAMTDPRVRELAVEFLGPFVRAGQQSGELRPDLDVADMVEWLIDQLFVMVSWSDHDPTRLCYRIRAFIVPAIAGRAPTAADPGLVTKLRVTRRRVTALAEALDDALELATGGE